MKRYPPYITDQALQITTTLEQGVHWSLIGGRKLRHSPLIVFGLRQWYRLVCWFEGDTLIRHKVLSHEEYNAYASNTRR